MMNMGILNVAYASCNINKDKEERIGASPAPISTPTPHTTTSSTHKEYRDEYDGFDDMASLKP